MCIINTATLSAFTYNTMKVTTKHKMERWRLIPIVNKEALLNLATHIATYNYDIFIHRYISVFTLLH